MARVTSVSFVAIGAGLADSCAACHSRPAARPEWAAMSSRDRTVAMPHIFSPRLEGDAGERNHRGFARRPQPGHHRRTSEWTACHHKLVSKGNQLRLTDRVSKRQSRHRLGKRGRPRFARASVCPSWRKDSIREFIVGALNDEMGLQAVDPELASAADGGRYVTPAGMVLDGSLDHLERPSVLNATDDADGDGKTNEVPRSIVDHLEFYLLNYFKPATYEETPAVIRGRRFLNR